MDGGLRNAKYALSSSVTACLTLKCAVGRTMNGTGGCLDGTVSTNGRVITKGKGKPLYRF